jgi:hypothetical protein
MKLTDPEDIKVGSVIFITQEAAGLQTRQYIPGYYVVVSVEEIEKEETRLDGELRVMLFTDRPCLVNANYRSSPQDEYYRKFVVGGKSMMGHYILVV